MCPVACRNGLTLYSELIIKDNGSWVNLKPSGKFHVPKLTRQCLSVSTNVEELNPHAALCTTYREICHESPARADDTD